MLLSAAAFALVAADAPSGGALKLRGAVGDVAVALAPGAAFAPAHSGDVLPLGAEIRTGAGSRVEIVLDAGFAKLYERSLVRIPRGPEGACEIELVSGAAGFDIRPRDGQPPYEVHTQSSVVLVKGTRFTVTADPDGSSVSVARGVVGVREPGSTGRELLVHSGFGATGGAGRPFALGLLDLKGDPWEAWSTGAAPSRPLPPPRTAALPPASADQTQVILQGPHDAALQVLASRGPDRVEIAGSDGFEATLSRRDLEQVLRGNTALLGPELLRMLRLRGVSPAAFAHQVLDNL
ncbi:MAG TPA: FecR family protein [Myxococcota bacterium]|nr:FecR family protein [Myxococcota bacterium]